MDELKQVLSAHAQLYPLMQPQDAVKLIYQNEFGGGHLISDPDAVLTRLQTERAGTAYDPAAPLLEEIGNGMVRVMLAAQTDTVYPLEQLNEDFVRSANLHTGNRKSFLQKLDILKELTRQGCFPFSAVDLEAYLTAYLSDGCPAVSHSAAYRDAYRPAYRVVFRDCLPPVPVILQTARHLSAPKDRPLLISIDGRCASGKTTLAARLQQALDCSVFHMDDFFLRPEQRTQERYETPGENVDHERFLEEVLLPLSQGEAVCYRPFDCSTGQLGDPIPVKPAPVAVIEGSYSCHPNLAPFYDLKVFLTLSPEAQMRRIILREGEKYAEVFRTRWIPLEERYFAACQVEKTANLRFET